MKPIGVVCALGWEARCLRGLPGLAATVSGLGAEPARAAAQTLVSKGVAALVSFGSAGGLDPALRAGDLMLPETVFDRAEQRVRTDAGWHAAMRARLAPSTVCTAALRQVSAPLLDPPAKAALRAATGAAAVDMESAAVAEVAAAAGLPFLILRVVLDDAGAALPAPLLAAVDGQGRPRPLALLAAFARRPGLVLSATALALARARAAATLRRAATVLAECRPGSEERLPVR